MRKAATVAALALMIGSMLGPATARADAIPGDEVCKPWEHWEGHHDGDCEFGPRCAVSPGTAKASGLLAALAVGLGMLSVQRAAAARLRRRRRPSRGRGCATRDPS